jgi:hypothetical protein
MPPSLKLNPSKLEDLCTRVYLNYLYDEIHLIHHLRSYEQKSVLLKHYGLVPERLIEVLQLHMKHTLRGILHDIVRQTMTDMIIQSLPNLVAMMEEQAKSAAAASGATSLAAASAGDDAWLLDFQRPLSSLGRPAARSPFTPAASAIKRDVNTPFKSSPIVQLLQLVLHSDTCVLDFSKNKLWPETERLQEVARTLWKIIGQQCPNLKKLVIPKELCYSSTLNSVIRTGGNLTHLTLKRNVPNNMFLSVIGSNCPNIRELDIAGADVVTDFGVICLLFQDPEQIFIESWNREKTVGSARRSQRAYPHPHFDKPIPDPQETVPGGAAAGAGGGQAGSGSLSGAARSSNQFLILKRTFFEVIKDQSFQWETFPICRSLQKLRLENTKVKGDGASVVLETCPNLYSLGYLVFAAAGLKQVFGYEEPNETMFLEIFYRGPSDQKLQTIANCCPRLRTMFLGSNNVRKMNVDVFRKWTNLQYLTLENIVVEDVSKCLSQIGKQLRGLKIQCSGFDVTDIVRFCPNLSSLIIQKEVPLSNVAVSRTSLANGEEVLSRLEHVEISCSSFPKNCFNFIMKNALALKSMKVLQVPGLKTEDIGSWQGALQHLETLIIFRGPELNRESVDLMLDQLPRLKVLGDLSSFDIRHRQSDFKRIYSRIKDEEWDLRIIDSDSSSGGSGVAGAGGGVNAAADEKEFTKSLSLHWFYLTEAPDGMKYPLDKQRQ